MASQESYVRITNHTKDMITLGISEVSSHDWDSSSRPDKNLRGKTISAGSSIREREEMNRWVRSCWYRLTIECKNGKQFSQRIDQAKALEPRHTSTDYYYCDNIGYAIKTRTNKEAGKDNLLITIEERGKLPKTWTSFSAGAVPVSCPVADKIAEHTYVFTSGDKEHNFPCWGTTDRRVRPLTREGDLELAIAIACYDPYDLRTNYNDHAMGIRTTGDFFGDCSGIAYGRTGVCHQMSNRIMYALDGCPNVGAYTPSYKASYAMYGTYGLENWSGYLTECQNRVNRGRAQNTDIEDVTPAQIKESLLKSSDQMDPFSRETLRLEITHEGSDDLPNLRMKLLIDTAFPDGYDSDKMAAIMEETTSFGKENLMVLQEPDDELVTKEDILSYVGNINAAFSNHLQRVCNILGEDDFEKVFEMKYDSNFILVNTDFSEEV